MAELYYFAPDGNYGTLPGTVILDTAAWFDEDWEDIDAASDWERPGIARAIAERRGQYPLTVETVSELLETFEAEYRIDESSDDEGGTVTVDIWRGEDDE